MKSMIAFQNYKMVLVLFYFLVDFLSTCESARILAVFPTPSISHQVVFRPLTQELARRGHEVVVITTYPAFPKGEAPANLTEIDIKDTLTTLADYILHVETKHFTGNSNEILNHWQTIYFIISTMVEKILENQEISKIINERQKFDLLILEDLVRPVLIFSHIFKAPVILLSSFGSESYNYKDIGAPVHLLHYPFISRQRLYKLSFWEEIMEMYNQYKIRAIMRSQEKIDNLMFKRKFGQDTPRLDEMASNIELLILNMHPILEDSRPTPPAVVNVWGLHNTTGTPLPDDLKSYLDSSEHGFIYVSFGSNMKPENILPGTIEILIKVFSQLPYDVLWKWNTDELPGRSRNIKIQKWFPQKSLLKHPKIKLFITQGGLQSTHEAINADVPLIGMPMFSDQWYNVEKYVHHGIGIKMLPDSMTEEGLKEAIETVIEDKSYRQNIVKLKTLLNDQPQPALERAVWWTEYVLRHGGARHLRAPAANISWAQYLELELFISLVVIFVLVITVFVTLFLIIKRMLKKSAEKSKIL